MGPADSERRQVAAYVRWNPDANSYGYADSDRHTELHTRMAD
jgi:hypothetical protein